MSLRPEISVIVPAYNEEENIRTMIEKTIKILKILRGEIIIVDDGSYDDTGMICDELSRKYSGLVKVIHFEKNIGKAGAIKTGIKETKGSYIATIDADLQYEPSDIPRLLEVLKEGNYYLVSGRRIHRKDSIIRKFFTLFFNLYNQLVFGIKIKDTNCGIKVYKREFFENLDLEFNGWFLDVEMLAKASKYGLPVMEVPIHHHYRKKGESKISLPTIISETLRYGLLLKLKLLKEKKSHLK